eukprot:TRINITY_DN5535_c0_g1_i1.p1 TRINITY_DN5535_c0_g1~~TRINITY_DN5535_c0_g1_i1.p1  ORF type:complete len:246 (+),score=26.48 TRINITY_DN5535_c0_g1_i1:148-885(+)
MEVGKNCEGFTASGTPARRARGRIGGRGQGRDDSRNSGRGRGRKRARGRIGGRGQGRDDSRNSGRGRGRKRAKTGELGLDSESEIEILLDSEPSFADSSSGFVVQCAECHKWRIVPSKQEYEMIRERETPFVCEEAAKWDHRVSCELPTDITPEDHPQSCMMDQAGIPSPPAGWQRVISVRGPVYRDHRFADVYYYAPCGRKLRSSVEIRKYATENLGFASEEALDAFIAKFNFRIPRPLTDFLH